MLFMCYQHNFFFIDLHVETNDCRLKKKKKVEFYYLEKHFFYTLYFAKYLNTFTLCLNFS